MMTVFLLVFGLMLLVVGGMSIGVMFGRKPISGSCGGVGAAGVGGTCSLCGGNPSKCDSDEPSVRDSMSSGQRISDSGFYDASKQR